MKAGQLLGTPAGALARILDVKVSRTGRSERVEVKIIETTPRSIYPVGERAVWFFGRSYP